jgi:SAM-dependent methyltransferase
LSTLSPPPAARSLGQNETIQNEGVQVEQVETCFLCGKQGAPLYTGLRDKLFSAPGVWQLLRCPECGLVWLTPQPVGSEFGKLYGTYYTHSDDQRSWRRLARDAALLTHAGCNRKVSGWGWRLVGLLLCTLPFVREAATVSTMHLKEAVRGRLVDVGCGSGEFLNIMRQAGWEVSGIDVDAQAADVARKQYGIEANVGSLEQAGLAKGSVDVLTMRHVIEHLPNPEETLHACWQTLKTSGRLILLTPNAEGLGHRFFRQDCISLDPPRHLYLFSVRTLQAMVERAGFRVEMLRTSTRLAGPTWVSSSEIRRTGKRQSSGATVWAMLKGTPFSVAEKVAHVFSPGVGEEIVLVARKS